MWFRKTLWWRLISIFETFFDLGGEANLDGLHLCHFWYLAEIQLSRPELAERKERLFIATEPQIVSLSNKIIFPLLHSHLDEYFHTPDPTNIQSTEGRGWPSPLEHWPKCHFIPTMPSLRAAFCGIRGAWGLYALHWISTSKYFHGKPYCLYLFPMV